MKKSLIALAVASAFVAPAAMAEVNVYGKVDMAFGSTNNGAISTNQISSQVTKLGFKGSEDLGDGLNVIWQIEQQIDIDNAASGQSSHNTFATRNSFAGLKSSSMGTVLMGRHDTPYKLATRGLDPFGDQLADNRSLMGGAGGANGPTATNHYSNTSAAAFDGRQGNVLAYITPDMNGFTGAVAYVAGAETATASTDTKGSAWSLMGTYKADALYGALAYEVHDLGTAGTGTIVGGAAGNFAAAGTKEHAWKLGVGYTLSAFDLGFVYEKTTDNLGGAGGGQTNDMLAGACTAVGQNCYGHSAYTLSGKYSFSNDDVKLAYTAAGKLNGAAAGTDTSAKQWSVGYDHNLSKTTSLYAQYTSIKNAANATYSVANYGSTAGGFAASAAGQSVNGFGLGLKHSF